MNELRNLNEEAYAYIENIGKERWANAFVHAGRYDMLTTNSAECTNSLLKDIRELPITRQVEEIRIKIMDFFQLRRDSSQMIESRLTPYFERFLSKEKDGSRRLQARQAGPEEYQIDSGYFVDVVHLDRRSCTCRQWDLMGIPCSHAMSAISYRSRDPYDFCEEWFSAETYRATYSQIVHATTDLQQWEYRQEHPILPPHARRQAGRPKKKRIRTEDRVRRQVTCSRCREVGHNRQSCKNPPFRN